MNEDYSLSEYLWNLFFVGGGQPIIFSTVEFWILLVVIISGLVLTGKHNTVRVAYLFAFSLFFYYKANGFLVFMMLATSFVDWKLSVTMARITSVTGRKCILAFSLLMNLGLLVYFKYSVFLMSSVNDLLKTNFPLPEIIYPVGISFYTFQSVAYMVDVYKRRTSPAARLLDYMFFLTFFPILLAGPIMRAEKFLPQIAAKPKIRPEMIWGGFWLLLLGVVKKAVIADYIMQFNGWVFGSPSDYTGLETVFAVIGYSAQIYCDFSGYSDMAIGVGAIMGYDLGVNFNRPYRSANVTEFWRRWHISLSSWLRDYLYIPLGGNRKGRLRMYFNLFVTMLVAGIWHGASWLFVIWGALHGIGLVVHKMCRPFLEKINDSVAVRIAGGILTFSFVTMLWPLFACHDMPCAYGVYRNIFMSFDISLLLPFVEARFMWVVLVLVVFVSQMLPDSFVDGTRRWFVSAPLVFKFIIFVIVVQAVVQFSAGNVAPFIYLQF